ncbi:MAG TPA: hypothetical protein VMG38_01310 [Trebonia sp.]|nr:hypothetical protein [Trebonia sp.]
MPSAATRRFRYLPLTGLLFIVLVAIGGPVLEGSTPGTSASGAAVISFYTAHQAQERAGAVVLALGFAVFLVFAGSLRAFWRQVADLEVLSALMLAGSSVVVAGQTITAGLNYTLASDGSRLAPSAAQLANVLDNDLVLTAPAGVLVFAFAAGTGILRSKGHLPSWLGWLVYLGGIGVLIPGGDFVGFILIMIWCAIVSVLVFRKSAAAAS